MTTGPWDVVGLGNAIVDVIAHAEDAFLVETGLIKGSMRLVEPAEAEALYDRMGPGVEMSGGSAGNTLAGLASFGGRGAFIGKVANDQLGAVYRHDIRAMGVAFDTPPLPQDDPDALPTGRCLILVTPDGQRTMSTLLGAANRLRAADVDPAVVGNAQVTYLEGYLWDREDAKGAFLRAAELAHGAGRSVALSLSDPFCVDRHRDSFLPLVRDHVDVLFANEAEISALYQTDFAQAAAQVRQHVAVAALTRSEKGAVVLTGDKEFPVPAEPVARVEDTTGAGDLFAAGFLFGMTRGLDWATCGRLGALAAAEVISHVGGRPQTSLLALAQARQLL